MSVGDRKWSAEAASTLPQASALLLSAGFVVSLAGWGWYRRHLLQSLQDLGSPFLIQADTDQFPGVVLEHPVAPVLPDRHTVSPLEAGQRVCPADRKSVV